MKKIFLLVSIFATVATTAQSVGINADGSAANTSAMLDVSSTTKGLLPPRMTGSEKTGIASPAQGLMIYCTNCGPYGELQVYNGSAWKNLTGGTAATLTTRVTINSVIWTVDNLAVTTYNDGTAIPQVQDGVAWAALTTGAWCYYYGSINYGILYNWYAVAGIHDNDANTPNKTLAPAGWHVPTSTELNTLVNAFEPKKLMATSTWSTSGYGTNETGFTAYATGFRFDNGVMSDLNINAVFWTSTLDGDNGGARWMNDGSSTYNGFSLPKKFGASVRLIRD